MKRHMDRTLHYPHLKLQVSEIGSVVHTDRINSNLIGRFRIGQYIFARDVILTDGYPFANPAEDLIQAILFAEAA